MGLIAGSSPERAIHPHPLFHDRYENLLESLEFRRAERDRIRRHLCQCSEDNQLVSCTSSIVSVEEY